MERERNVRDIFSLFLPVDFSLIQFHSRTRLWVSFSSAAEILNFQLVFFQLSGSMNSALALFPAPAS
jgi:hypothetical protein